MDRKCDTASDEQVGTPSVTDYHLAGLYHNVSKAPFSTLCALKHYDGILRCLLSGAVTVVTGQTMTAFVAESMWCRSCDCSLLLPLTLAEKALSSHEV